MSDNTIMLETYAAGSPRPKRVWIFVSFVFLLRLTGTNNECVVDLTDVSGIITSPNYPDSYPRNYNCSWVIHVAPGSSIQLTFLSFSLESSSGCLYEYVEIRQNDAFGTNLTSRLCGTKKVTLQSSMSLWIFFKTDSTTQYSGFRAQYIQSVTTADLVKLVGGRDRYEGRVQVYYQGSWITLCSDIWTAQNSLVVCRSLFGDRFRGLLIPSTVTSSPSTLGQGVYCSGAERHFLQCSRYGPLATSCQQNAYVSVRCLDGVVRLARGSATNVGALEIRVSDTWVPVCGNSFDASAASVVCRELGFPSAGATFTVSSDSSRQADSRWYCCTGDEDFLAQCQNEQKACSSLNSVRVVCSLPDCGVVRSSSFSPRIVGGFAAAESQFPWMVMLTEGNKFFCGGTIIDPQHVVTAAHCLEDLTTSTVYRITDDVISEVKYVNTTSLYIIAGKHQFDTSYAYIGEQKVKVAAALNHAQYKLGYGEFSYDIALLRLERPLNFNVRVSPLCLTSPLSSIPAQCILAGWGNLNGQALDPKTLMTATMTAYNRQGCLALESQMSYYDKFSLGVNLARDLAPQTMCLANVTRGGQETCFGDSGGPVFCLASGGLRYDLIGVVSWGYGSCPALRAFPSIQTYVPAYLAWISDTVVQLASPCIDGPCPNYSTCQEEGDNYLCLCPGLLHGPRCESCGQVLTDASYTIRFQPYYYSYYREDCEWTVLVAPGKFVELTFENLRLPSDATCNNYIEVRQNNSSGQVLARACATTPPPAIADKTSLYIHFHSRTNYTSTFSASYVISDHPSDNVRLVNGDTSSQGTLELFTNNAWQHVCGNGFDNNSVTVICRELGFHSTNATFAVGSYGAVPADNRRFQCTGTEDRLALCPKYWTACTLRSLQVNCYGCRRAIRSSQGTITSARYPDSSVSDAGCEWTIEVPLGLTINLIFLDIDLGECTYDYIEVHKASGQGELLAKLCGRYLPSPFTSNTTLWLRHVRGSSPGTYRGFKANYRVSGCPKFTYGNNCSKSCSCADKTTLTCDEVDGSCNCKEGWEGATCADDVNECADRCTRSEEVCTNTVGSFQCSCVDGAAKNALGTCVDITRFPMEITIYVDVDLDETNTTQMASLISQMELLFQLQLEKKSVGILGIKVNNVRRGSLIVSVDGLLDTSVAVTAASELIKELKNLLDTPIQVNQDSGTSQFLINGRWLTQSTSICDVITSLHLCGAKEQCDDSSGQVVCRPVVVEDNSKFETWKIIVIAVCCGVGLVAIVITVAVCVLRARRAQTKSGGSDRNAGPSMISSGMLAAQADARSPSSSYSDLTYGISNPALAPDLERPRTNGYVNVQPSSSLSGPSHYLPTPPSATGPSWQGYGRPSPTSPVWPAQAHVAARGPLNQPGGPSPAVSAALQQGLRLPYSPPYPPPYSPPSASPYPGHIPDLPSGFNQRLSSTII